MGNQIHPDLLAPQQRIHPNLLTEAEIAERRKQLTRDQIEEAIIASPLDGYDLADIIAAVQAKALLLNRKHAFRFDVEELRDALADLENE
jgi:DUF1365 family protein